MGACKSKVTDNEDPVERARSHNRTNVLKRQAAVVADKSEARGIAMEKAYEEAHRIFDSGRTIRDALKCASKIIAKSQTFSDKQAAIIVLARIKMTLEKKQTELELEELELETQMLNKKISMFVNITATSFCPNVVDDKDLERELEELGLESSPGVETQL